MTSVPVSPPLIEPDANQPIAAATCRVRWTSLAIFMLSLSMAVLILAAAVDILRQTSQAPFDTIAGSLETFQISLRTFVVGGSYILLAVMLIVWSSNRAVSVRFALGDIPKKCPPPIKSFPRPVGKLVSSELLRIENLKSMLEPQPDEPLLAGWGRVPLVQATPNDQRIDVNRLIHYKRAVIQTLTKITAAATASSVTGPSNDGSWSRPLNMSVRAFLGRLAESFGVHQQVMKFYSDCYIQARFSEDEINEGTYRDLMRCVVVILKAFVPFYKV
jgi:hypothetical protein